MDGVLLENLLEPFGSYLYNDCGHTEGTRERYLGNLRRIFRNLNLHTLEDVQKADINKRWMSYFWECMDNGQNFSDQTRRNILAALKKFLKFLEHDRLIDSGIAASIVLPKAEIRHYDGLNPEEQRVLKTYLYTNLGTDVDRRNSALIMFLWATGCRISEALKLNCAADSVIYYNPLKKSGDFSVFINEREEWRAYAHINGKGKRNRSIPISDDVVEILNLYLHFRPVKNEILFQSHSTKPDYNGSRLTRFGAYSMVCDTLKNAGIDKSREQATHIFRHTFIEDLINQGISSVNIISMTGHASENGLEPYFRRSKLLTHSLGGDINPFTRVKVVDDKFDAIEKLKKITKNNFRMAII